jgi:GNAT superfamily N-acetyltransferase
MAIKEIKPSDTWQIRHQVMWPDLPFEFVQLAEDDLGLHFGFFINEKLVSIVSCFISNDEMQFRKLATLEEYQGKGVASALLSFIFELAKEKGIKKIWCNARSNKTSFYEKFKMKTTDQKFVKSEQEFIIMEILF